ncbi:MAG: hypothetical protein U0T81_03805 [Saprospiraceae bacterium]
MLDAIVRVVLPYYHVGSFEVKVPDNQWIAYSVDQVSRRQYTIL